MQLTDFEADSPGRLVPAQGTVAFVPASMPAELPLTSAVVRLLSDADFALGRLTGASGRLVNPYLIGQPLLRREAILSSRIEGTFTTPEQLALLEAGVPQDAATLGDTREVLNYMRAMEHGLALLKKMPVSLRLVRELHNVLLDGVRGGQDRPGEFRTVQNYIGSRNAPISAARYVPPPVPEMKDALDQWERGIHLDPDPLPLLVRSALSHYQFEAIHPFRDGNGRVGRLLIPLILCERERLSDPLLYMSSYFERYRDEYVDGLLRVSTHGDWDAWLRFFLAGVVVCARESLTMAEELLALRDRYHAAVRSARSSGLLATLIDALFRVPTLTIAQAAALTGVTPASASSNLQKLVQLKIVDEVSGRTRGQVFLAKELLSFVGRHLGEAGSARS